MTMKRALLILLTLLMLISVAGGCAKTTESSSTGTTAATTTAATTAETTASQLDYLNMESTLPIIKEGENLTLKLVSVSSVVVDPKDQWLWAFYKEYGNLDLDVKLYDVASWGEQKNLLFTSGDLPDIFWQCAFSAQEMVRYGQAEGMFYPIEEILDYAPLLKQAIEENPSIQMESTTPDGHFYCIPNIANPDDYPLSTARYYIHQAWLDKLQLDMPKTLNDLTSVLAEFKGNDLNENGQIDEIPWAAFLGSSTSGNAATMILTALGINAGSTTDLYARDDGKLSIGAYEENYIEYLKYMKDLFDQGLIDPDFYTMTVEQFNAKISQNSVGLAAMGAPFVYLPDPAQYEEYQPLPPLTSDFNDEQIWPIGSQISQGTFAIAYNTEYPEAAIRVADVQFIHIAPVLFWLGPIYTEGETAEYFVEGYTEGLFCGVKDGAIFADTPGGIGIWDYLPTQVQPYNGGPIGYGWSQAIFEEMIGDKGEQVPQEQFWRIPFRANVVPHLKLTRPSLFLAPDKLESSNGLILPITDYVKTMEAKFIMGKEPLENIDDFYAQLETLGIKEYLQLQQEAYDAYLANQ